MIKEFDYVIVIKTGKRGIVLDVRNTDTKRFLVELDEGNQIVDCIESDIKKVE